MLSLVPPRAYWNNARTLLQKRERDREEAEAAVSVSTEALVGVGAALSAARDELDEARRNATETEQALTVLDSEQEELKALLETAQANR